MPRATTAVIGVVDALRIRDFVRTHDQPDPSYACTECGQPVRPHAAGSQGDAHFEHLDRITACALSDPPRLQAMPVGLVERFGWANSRCEPVSVEGGQCRISRYSGRRGHHGYSRFDVCPAAQPRS